MTYPRLHEVIPSTGLKVLVDPDEPSLDIVFIHGFTGHPERTWTHKRGDVRHCNEHNNFNESAEPPLKARKLNLFSRSHQGGGDSYTAVYWPRDLVPATIPNARVLTYGYDTHIRHWLGPPVSRNTVCDIAWDFLVALEAERRLEPSRPILFIVHSLGGIVVKEALRRSSGCRIAQTHLRGIFESTVGIVFFGTPHGGADPRGVLQCIAEKVIKAAGFDVNEHIVSTLLPSSERLRELRDEFIPMAHQEKWIIHSFQEQLGVKLLSGHKVVEDTSSYLSLPTIETTEHIGRNHMDMCRFTGLEDVEYRKVAAALRRMITEVSGKSRRGQIASVNAEQKRMLLDSLRFDQIDARQVTIKNAHAKTCKWLLKKAEYLDWLDVTKLGEHHGFFWIKGKPGTGKSTLMKFALANARRTMKDRIIVSFFFNARGEDLEKSTIGMYRSLLLQLLERVPELQCVLDSLGFTTWSSSGYHQYSVESLKELFGEAIQSLGRFSVACFIDALDECDERQIRDMVSFFEHVGEIAVSAGVRFQVCFSSRHYPHITIKIKNGLGLVLEGQEGHNQDITNYLDSELKIGHSKLAEQIRGQLQEKASGVFMWVVLVVEILNKEYDGGRIHALQQKLRDIPGDLHELFRDILTRDYQNRNELLLCIQWVLFARQPLKPEQLYFAILSGVEPDVLSSWNSDEITMDVIQRFILNSSKGLAEITKSKTPTVQFIHEAVRDFLLQKNGLGEVWPGVENNFQGRSHERLKWCCLTYMAIDTAAHLDLSKPLPKASSMEATVLRQSATTAFPFLEYAVRNVLYHANVAAGNGLAQGDLIEGIQLANWIMLDNLFEKHEVRRHTPKASFLYILAEGNMSNLIRLHPRKLSYLEIGDERYGPPLFAALAHGSNEAVGSFLTVEAENQCTSTALHELYNQYCQGGNKKANFGRDFRFSRRRTVISYVVEHDDEILLAFLLATGKVDADSRDKDGRTPLSWAAGNGQEAIVKLLLATGNVDADSRDKNGRTPLWWAAINGHEAVVKLLLATGNVDADSRDNDGRTPLWWAARKGYEAVVKLLLATDNVDADSRDKDGRTPLWWAAKYGHEAVVKLLLATDNVDAHLRDNAGRTPLWWATTDGHEAVVKLLLATDKHRRGLER
ncbi:MAG: hypothetical protein M1816_003160 [Peltula sp. TS41687]|nr:MAG: hypothetical protein M1816_003160 [Peltula sp. TS41687]